MNTAIQSFDPKSLKKIVIGSFAGALLEWYDFFIFGTAAGIILGPLFFPQDNPTISMMAAFATFGVGFLARPIGGIIFGHFGDKYGRKVTLVWTICIVGVSTFLVGCIPTFETIGILAPILLVILRLIQGFGLGGEYGGAALMTIESSPEHKRGFYGSLPQMAASAGIMLATGIFALCNYLLTSEQFSLWGWRIPFLVSILMLVVGLFIRLHTEETIDFKDKNKYTSNSKKESIPIIQLFKKHPKNIVLAFGARLAETVSSNMINAFGISYVSIQLALNRQIPLTGMMIASIIGIIICPIIGRLSDRYSQKIFYLIGSGFCLIFIFPFFILLNTEQTFFIWIAIILGYNLGPTMMFAVQPTMFARMFGTKVRYTGLSFAYQFSAILGGMTPLISSTLLALDAGSPWYVACYMAIISIISFICVCAINTKSVIKIR